MNMQNPRYANGTGAVLLDQADGVSIYVDSGELLARAVAGEFGTIAPYVAPVPTTDEIAASLESAVQSHLDETARTRRYDNIVSACSYAGASNRFQAESIAFVQWRAAVWDYCYQVLADVQAGTRAIPSATQLISELPLFTD